MLYTDLRTGIVLLSASIMLSIRAARAGLCTGWCLQIKVVPSFPSVDAPLVTLLKCMIVQTVFLLEMSLLKLDTPTGSLWPQSLA